jgi:phage host-nuclease inhibitor protein Gam
VNIFEAADKLGAKEGITGEEYLARVDALSGQVELNLSLDELPLFLDTLSERGQAIFPSSDIEQMYSEKLTGIEEHFRTRIAEVQGFGDRMAALAVLFFVWALVATSIAIWLSNRPGPGDLPQVLNLRQAGAERMSTMLLNVESPEQVEQALSLRAQRQVKLLAATTKRAGVVMQAEQTFMAIATPLENEIAEIDEALEGYYRANKKTIEAEGKRRLETPMGNIGMRRTPAKLVCAKKTTTWAKVVSMIEQQYAGDEAKLAELLRVKTDPEKKALAKLPKDELAAVGCKIVSEDEFFVENTPAALDRFKAA